MCWCFICVYQLVTIYSLVENYKINGSLARKGIQELIKRGLIQPVQSSGTYGVWTKSASVIAAEAAAKAEKKTDEKAAKPAKGGAKKEKAAAAAAE